MFCLLALQEHFAAVRSSECGHFYARPRGALRSGRAPAPRQVIQYTECSARVRDTRTSGLHLAFPHTQATIMNNGFTALLVVLGIAVSARAYAQDVAPLALKGQVFPEALCENLPEVRPTLKTWVAQVAPELAQVQVRELPEKTALDVFGRAAVAGWGSVDVLTNSAFREPCTFYFSREALRAVDAAFVLDLVTVIRGQDKKGHDFEMTALLAGRGKLVVLYNRDGIIYRNERLARDFKLALESNSKRRLPVYSKMSKGSAPKFCCWVACASDPS